MKVIKLKYQLLSFLLLFLISCTDKEESSKKNIVTKPVSLNVLNPGREVFDDTTVIDIKSVISIDTSEAALLGEVSKGFYINEEYYLVDPIYSVIKVFDKEGHFKRNIGKIGAGPGEYAKLFDADFDENDSTFLIYSNDSRVLNKYTLDGIFIEKKHVPFFAYYFCSIPNQSSYFFYVNYNSSEINNRHNLLETDFDIEVKKKYFPYAKDEIPAFAYSGKISKNNEGVLFANALEDTIFQVSKNYTYPKHVVNFENFSCPISLKEDMNKLHKELLDKAYLNSDFIENPNSLMFSFIHKRRKNIGIWSKISQRIILSKNLKENTLLNLMAIPVGILPNGDFMALIRPEVVIAYLEDDKNYLNGIKQLFPQLYNHLVTLHEGSNYVLVIFNTK